MTVSRRQIVKECIEVINSKNLIPDFEMRTVYIFLMAFFTKQLNDFARTSNCLSYNVASKNDIYQLPLITLFFHIDLINVAYLTLTLHVLNDVVNDIESTQ